MCFSLLGQLLSLTFTLIYVAATALSKTKKLLITAALSAMVFAGERLKSLISTNVGDGLEIILVFCSSPRIQHLRELKPYFVSVLFSSFEFTYAIFSVLKIYLEM